MAQPPKFSKFKSLFDTTTNAKAQGVTYGSNVKQGLQSNATAAQNVKTTEVNDANQTTQAKAGDVKFPGTTLQAAPTKIAAPVVTEATTQDDLKNASTAATNSYTAEKDALNKANEGVSNQINDATKARDVVYAEGDNRLDKNIGVLAGPNLQEQDSIDMNNQLLQKPNTNVGVLGSLFRNYDPRAAAIDSNIYQGDINSMRDQAATNVSQASTAGRNRDIAREAFGKAIASGREETGKTRDQAYKDLLASFTGQNQALDKAHLDTQTTINNEFGAVKARDEERARVKAESEARQKAELETARLAGEEQARRMTEKLDRDTQQAESLLANPVPTLENTKQLEKIAEELSYLVGPDDERVKRYRAEAAKLRAWMAEDTTGKRNDLKKNTILGYTGTYSAEPLPSEPWTR